MLLFGYKCCRSEKRQHSKFYSSIKFMQDACQMALLSSMTVGIPRLAQVTANLGRRGGKGSYKFVALICDIN